MKWTREQPKVPGWYWWRPTKRKSRLFPVIQRVPESLLPSFNIPGEGNSGWWCGPIEEPTWD